MTDSTYTDPCNPTKQHEYIEYAAELGAPSDYKPGCKPRESRPGQHCPMFASKVKLIPRNEWAKWAKLTNLRLLVKSILDQNGYGSCAAEAVTQAIMIARLMAGLPHVKLNPWAMYRTTSGGRDQGSNIEDNIRYAMEFGVPSMAVHPRSKGVFGSKGALSDEAVADALNYRILEYYDVSTVDEFVTAMLKGFPVVWGAKGHALCKVRHLNEREGEDANSWDTSWGDEGFGVWAPYNGINWGYGAHAIRLASMAT